MTRSRYVDMLYRGISNPWEAFRYVMSWDPVQHQYRTFLHTIYELYRRRRDMRLQKELIDETTQQDEFVIVMLDACRFDYFSRVYPEYFEGDVQVAWASGNNTPNYFANTWTDDYELTYVSASPWASDLAWESKTIEEPLVSASNHGYRPSRHLSDVKHIWLSRWDVTQFTVPPEETTEAAMNRAATSDRTRMIAHYLQPHRPYIGDPGISPWSESVEMNDVDDDPGGVDLGELFEERSEITLEEIYRYDLGFEEFARYDLEFPRLDIQKSIEEGDLTLEGYRDAYEANLRRALGSIAELAAYVDCPVYITADHGEFLGETNRFLHANFTHPLLRMVPYLEVTESLATEFEEHSPTSVETGLEETADASNVEERLKQLGYLRD